MPRAARLAAVCCLFLLSPRSRADEPTAFRPPSVPLVVHDPYFSVWSPADKLTDADTVHWTGKRQALASLIRIDEQAYRLMGTQPEDVPALPQTGLGVFPTRTVYTFEGAGVKLTLTFLTPTLPDDLDLLSRPVTYITWEARSADGKPHQASVYFDASAELAVNEPGQRVVAARQAGGPPHLLRVGTKDQPVLRKKGDDLRIDWGYAYLTAAQGSSAEETVTSGPAGREAFAAGKPLPALESPEEPRAVRDGWPSLALVLPLGAVGESPVTSTALIAYDDIEAIDYMGKRLPAYWRRKGAPIAEVLAKAAADHAAVRERCRRFDEDLLAALEAAGGPAYADIASLAYRQAMAGNKLAADGNGMPLLFPKECFSNGCIATVDVIYPMGPLFLLLGPALSKAMLAPVLEYGASSRWTHPFAPHDLGTYPLATGQIYGGGERTEEDQMPVEESGNMIILTAALAEVEGNADFAKRYWPALSRWAAYLKEKGFDPPNQLCTDDFAGHLAHNVNLSGKAIVALGAYARLAQTLGKDDEAKSYRRTAEEFAKRWIELADDGSHFRLTFDGQGTWSQKYNLVWDRLLGLGLFPESAVRKEADFYRTVQNRFGLPLDGRKDYTKLDWVLWTATWCGERGDFDALVSPVRKFLQESPSRVPMTDWYGTKSGKMVGFQARPVVGGVFIRLLADREVWKRWAARGEKLSGEWAAIPERPKPPKVHDLVATSEKEGASWRYTLEEPAEGWWKPEFNDGSWQSGPAGFGTKGTPGSIVRTKWRGPHIWMRREVRVDSAPAGEVRLRMHHDEDARVWINGVLAADESGFTSDYELVPISSEARAALRPGKNVIAVECRQTSGGQYIDVGLVMVE